MYGIIVEVDYIDCFYCCGIGWVEFDVEFICFIFFYFDGFNFFDGIFVEESSVFVLIDCVVDNKFIVDI